MQHELRDLRSRRRCRHRGAAEDRCRGGAGVTVDHAEIFRRRGRHADRPHGRSACLKVGHFAEVPSVFTAFEPNGGASGRSPSGSSSVRKRHRTDHLRFGELEHHPRLASGPVGQQSPVGQIIVAEFREPELAAAGRQLRPHLLHGQISVDQRHRDHGHVLVVFSDGSRTTAFRACVLERSGGSERLGQFSAVMPPAFNDLGTPHKLLHRVLGLHPGGTGSAPARAARYRHLKPQGVSQFRGVSESVLPVVLHVDQALVHDLLGRQCGVEVMEASEAYAVHPFKVFPDAVPGHVAPEPVPPDLGPGLLGRIVESGSELVDAGLLLSGAGGKNRR